MQPAFAHRFTRSWKELPARVKKDFGKQLDFLLLDLRHPSLRAKKYDEAQHIWQMRVNKSWRCYFVIRGDIYYFLDIILHP